MNPPPSGGGGVSYQQATIGFYVDLTAPNSQNIPIANLLVDEAEGRQVSGVALFVPDHLDPLTKAVLNDTHQLVCRYLDEAFMCRSPTAPLSAVLARVSRLLRDTVHVSVIGEPAEVQVAELGQLGGAVVHLLYRGLVAALADPAPNEGIGRYFGQWPGDEDDEQVFAALRELS
jgi:hypothetical protein